MRATEPQGYVAGPAIDAPITVAFGSRDRLLRAPSRRLDELPSGTPVETLPGCGHVPMADDPGAVVDLISKSVARVSKPLAR
jgi:pimeloyl-ACP methyl ester carboxylesterase